MHKTILKNKSKTIQKQKQIYIKKMLYVLTTSNETKMLIHF